MRVVECLTPERSLLLRSKSKKTALRALANAVCRHRSDLSVADVLAHIESREREISTLIAPGIALPHARLPQLDESIVAIGLHKEGLPWQAVASERVHLIILVLGSEHDPSRHIQLLADIARHLGAEETRNAVLSARSAKALYEAFAGKKAITFNDRARRRDRVTRGLLTHAAELATDTPHACVMVHDDGDFNPEWLAHFPRKLPVIL